MFYCTRVTFKINWAACDYKAFDHYIISLLWRRAFGISTLQPLCSKENASSQHRWLWVMRLRNIKWGNLIQPLRNSAIEPTTHRYIVLFTAHQLLSTFPTNEAPSLSREAMTYICHSLHPPPPIHSILLHWMSAMWRCVLSLARDEMIPLNPSSEWCQNQKTICKVICKIVCLCVDSISITGVFLDSSASCV